MLNNISAMSDKNEELDSKPYSKAMIDDLTGHLSKDVPVRGAVHGTCQSQ
jgi:hypothetical protein